MSNWMRIASSIGWVTDSYDERPDWGATLMGIGVVSPPSTLNGRWIGEKWRQSGVTISGMVKARKGYIKHAGHWVQHPLSYNTIQHQHTKQHNIHNSPSPTDEESSCSCVASITPPHKMTQNLQQPVAHRRRVELQLCRLDYTTTQNNTKSTPARYPQTKSRVAAVSP